jgi:aminopeptidase N
MKLLRALCPLLALAFASLAFGQIKHNYDLKNVLWKLTFDPVARTVSGDATNTLTLAEDTPTVQLHAYHLDISSVIVDGRVAKFESANSLLTIQLPSPGNRGETIKVRLIYTASPHRGFYFIDPGHAYPAKTGMVYTQGEGVDNRAWLPTYDLPNDKATTECFVTVPKGWTAISNGKLLGVEDSLAGPVFHWKMDQPFSTYLISLVAGPYTQVREHWRQTPVDFYVPPGLEQAGMRSFGNTPKMIDLYSKLTGVDYPYPKFAQEAVGDFVVGGMENITAVTQTIQTLHDAGTEPLNDSTYLVAHELAHQWFGDLVTCRTWEHMWLNEGFATFMPTMLDRAWHGQERFDLDRYQNFEGAVDQMGDRNRKEVDGDVGSVEQVTMGSPYPGGASRIAMLMHRLGEPLFWKGIHQYLETYKFQPATTRDFFESMSKTTGQDLSDYERQWYHSPATPSLAVSLDGGQLVLSQLRPYYNLDLPVWFWHTGSGVGRSGAWVKKTIHIDGPAARMPLGEFAGDAFLVDPEVWTLTELKYNAAFTPEQIEAMYWAAPNVAERARIVSEFFAQLPDASRLRIATRENSEGLLALIAPKLGAAGKSTLLDLTRSANMRVVDAVVNALGDMPIDAVTQARLVYLSRNSSNPTLREHSVRALLNQTTDPAFAARAWETKAFDDGFRVLALKWWAKNDAALARSRSLEILAGEETEPLQLAACGVLGQVGDGPNGHLAFDALIKVAQENSYRCRATAIQALGQLGNRAALPILRAIPEDSSSGVLGAAQDAIRQLEK